MTLKLTFRDELGVTQAKDVGKAIQGEGQSVLQGVTSITCCGTTGHLVRPQDKARSGER